MFRTRAPPRTPPSETQLVYVEESTETPGPVRAQINHLKRQVNDLVRNEHNAARKHTAEMAALQQTISTLKSEAKDSGLLKKNADLREAELKRLREEGEKMREELNLHSIIAQQKALMAVAAEQLKMVEMEQRLVQAEAARLMRDHKISLFKAREAELEADLAEKEATIECLEVDLEEANTSLNHQRAAQAKASKLESESSKIESDAQISTLTAKVNSLETKLRSSKEREKELKEELETALNDTKTSGSDKEKRDLQKALREAKAATEQKSEEISDLQEELTNVKEASKQREQALKAKVKDAALERDRLLGVEEELAGLKASKGRTKSPVKVAKPIKPKKRPRGVESDDEEPYKPPVKDKVVKAKVPALRETSDNEISSVLSKPKAKMPAAEEPKSEPEKKKKRKLLGGVKAAFEWDSIMQSGDGVIPAYLSPAKPMGNAIGTIPRAGFKSMASARGLNKLL